MQYFKKILCCTMMQIIVLMSCPFFILASLPSAAVQRTNQAVVLYTGCSRAYINNVEKYLDAQPVIQNDRTLVPVRFISESMGAQVDYDPDTKKVTVSLDSKIIQLVLNSNIMLINNIPSSLDVPAQIIGNRTFIPLRALTEALGKKVFYNNGLIVISDQDNIFNPISEKYLIDQMIVEFTGQAVVPSVNSQLELEQYNGGVFTVSKPSKWEVITNGQGSTFSFLIRDPKETARQIFYFGEVGPVYLLEEQRQLDQWYMSMGGYPIQWIDTPAVNPLTPENFLKNFHVLMATKMCQTFMPKMSYLDNVEIIASKSMATPFTGGKAAVMRALFKHEGKLCEGLFSVSVAPLIPYSNMAGGGIGYGFMFTGIAAPQEEFRNCEAELLKSLQSFTFSQAYLNQCMVNQNNTWKAIFKTGQILNSTSDIIMDAWNNRSKVEDILSEKRSDAILGRERLYDPDTGTVYEFENGFYDNYDFNRNGYDMSNLQLLPDNNHDLWITVPLDGYANLH